MKLQRPTPPASGMVSWREVARAAPSLGGNLLSTWLPRPLAKVPSFVSWVLTERCPLRCEHCDMGEARRELSAAERQDVARQIAASGVWAASLVGGEVAILPDLAACAATLKRGVRYVSVATSGAGLARHLDDLMQAHIDGLVLSLDHVEAADHDRFRGVRGLHGKVEAAIERVLSQRKNGRPKVQLRFTIHRKNFRELAAFMQRWHGRVDTIVLQIVQDNGLHKVRDRSVVFQPEDRAELEAVLSDVGRRWPSVRTRTFELMARYTYEAEALRQDLGFRCLLVPATQLVILPDGDLRLCYGRDDSHLGNLRDGTLSELWRSDAATAIRRRMQSKDYGCMCWEAACAGNLDLLPVAQAVDAVTGGGSGRTR